MSTPNLIVLYFCCRSKFINYLWIIWKYNLKNSVWLLRKTSSSCNFLTDLKNLIKFTEKFYELYTKELIKLIEMSHTSSACQLQHAPELSSHHVVPMRTGSSSGCVFSCGRGRLMMVEVLSAPCSSTMRTWVRPHGTLNRDRFLFPATYILSVCPFHEHTLPLILPAYKHVVLLLTRPCGWILLVDGVPIVWPRLPWSPGFAGSDKLIFSVFFFFFSSF